MPRDTVLVSPKFRGRTNSLSRSLRPHPPQQHLENLQRQLFKGRAQQHRGFVTMAPDVGRELLARTMEANAGRAAAPRGGRGRGGNRRGGGATTGHDAADGAGHPKNSPVTSGQQALPSDITTSAEVRELRELEELEAPRAEGAQEAAQEGSKDNAWGSDPPEPVDATDAGASSKRVRISRCVCDAVPPTRGSGASTLCDGVATADRMR